MPSPSCAPAVARNEGSRSSKLAISSSISDQADVIVWEDSADVKDDDSAGETASTQKEESVDDSASSESVAVA